MHMLMLMHMHMHMHMHMLMCISPARLLLGLHRQATQARGDAGRCGHAGDRHLGTA